MNPQIDSYLEVGCGRCPKGGTPACKVHQWPDILRKLRQIVLECGLEEELKWGVPCYAYRGKNVLNIAAFKPHAALSFFKGSLLQDPDQVLHKPGSNSHYTRQARFTHIDQLLAMEQQLKAFIFEAIEVEKSGKKIEVPRKKEEVPEELSAKLAEDALFKAAFEKLTPGRQRAYILYFGQAKQAKTRLARIEKYTPHILRGEGLNDRYQC